MKQKKEKEMIIEFLGNFGKINRCSRRSLSGYQNPHDNIYHAQT
jgi:hypothetical protein